jgi:hypothetical protein
MLLFSPVATSQFKVPTYQAGIFTQAGVGDQAPFWIISNQWAKNSVQPYAAGMEAGIFSAFDSLRDIDYSFGIDLVERYDVENDFYLQEGYLGLKTWFLEFRAGRFKEIIGTQPRELSMGSTMWSKNARPMPQLEVSTSNWVDLPLTRGYISFKGQLSHGWFEQERFVKDVYMHHKNLYVKLGGDFPVNVSYGLEHFAQWGGKSPDSRYGNLPSDFQAFKRVFFAESGDSSRVHMNEVINRLGNHLGSRNYRIDLKFDKLLASLYYQTIFEDNSGRNDKISEDGLWGLYFEMKKRNGPVDAILFEYLNTTWQSGPLHNIGDSVVGGNDSYFLNYIYRTGWTYEEFTIGTPMITSPILNENNTNIINNRVRAFHGAIMGNTRWFGYKMLLTYSINKGRYNHLFVPDRNQFSGLVSLSREIKVPFPFTLSLQLGMDQGKMYGNNYGILLSLIKKGSF